MIPALLTRTGVFRYTQADGSVRRELRLPDEVFAEDALATLDTVPVTVGHPGKVTPDNWKTLAVGDVRNVKKDGRYVAADVAIRDAVTLQRVDSGDLVELSCGYDCALEMKSGSYDGEDYDAIQRTLRYNHVGLGPEGWGRAGAEVRLRLDGAENADIAATYTPAMADETKDLTTRIDGLTKDLARRDAELEKATKDLEKISGERDALKSELDKSRADSLTAITAAGAASDPKRIDSLVRQRMTVIDGARVLHGKLDIDVAKIDREIMVDAIKARDDKFDSKDETGNLRSDDYIRARFDLTVEQVKKAGGGLSALNAATGSPELTSDGQDDLEKAQKKFAENNKKAHADWLAGNASAE